MSTDKGSDTTPPVVCIDYCFLGTYEAGTYMATLVLVIQATVQVKIKVCPKSLCRSGFSFLFLKTELLWTMPTLNL